MICALTVLAFISAADAQPVPDSIEGHLAAGKNAAGGRDNTADFYGLVTAICVAPQNAPVRPDAPRAKDRSQSGQHIPDAETGV
jgi:hypothetical protein